MNDEREPDEEDPAVVGVPPETPDAVRPSATGLVTGPLDTDTDVEVRDYRPTREERAALAAGGDRIDGEDDPQAEIEGPNSA